MRPSRILFLPAIAVLVLLSLISPVLAQTEVDRAADEVARAEARRAEVQAEVDAWAARRGTVHDELVAALFELQQTNTALEGTSFELFELRERILATEERVRTLRQVAEDRAIESYMDGTALALVSIWSASSFEESAIVEETAAAARRADLEALEALSEARSRLRDLHQQSAVVEGSLRDLRGRDLDQKHALEELLAQVDARFAVSYQDLDRADARYRDALSAWEEAQRRRAARAGVEPWRPLVEQYFPSHLVEEALAVMSCESGGNPDAVNADSDASGLFQFLAPTWVFSSVSAGFSGASRFDAEANIAAAAWLVSHSIQIGHPGGRWGHWVCRP